MTKRSRFTALRRLLSARRIRSATDASTSDIDQGGVSSVQWWLVQFTPNRRRKEPRNIGVIVAHNERLDIELLDADLARARCGISPNSYEAGVSYYRGVVARGELDEIFRTQALRASELTVVWGGVGTLPSGEDHVERLFEDLVVDDPLAVANSVF